MFICYFAAMYLYSTAFLNYKKMTTLQKEIKDNWWKVLLLMDIPFKTLEKTLSDPGDFEEKVNGVIKRNTGCSLNAVLLLLTHLLIVSLYAFLLDLI